MRVEEVTMKNWFRAFIHRNDQDPSFITLVRIVLGIAAISGLGMAIGLNNHSSRVNYSLWVLFLYRFLNHFLWLAYR
jgi:hypothetical protein